MTCTSALMIFRPPGAPHTRNGRSLRRTIVGDAVKALGAALRVRAEVLAVEGLQRVRYGRAASEARQRQDTVLAIAERLRGPLVRLVGREVLAGQDAAQGANVLDDRRAKLTLVERARSVASQRLERAREIGLLQTLRRLEAGRRPIGCAAGPVVHTLRLGIAVQPCRVRAEDERPVPIHHEAVVRETDGGIEQPRPGELSVSAVRELVRGDASWNAEREGPFDVRVTFHRRPAVHPGACVATRELEHLLLRRERRAGRSVERAGLSIAPHHEPGDPTETAADRRNDT